MPTLPTEIAMQLRIRRFALIARTFPTVACLFLAPTLLLGGERKHSDDASLFSEAEYRKHLTYLASDELEGRGTGQEGIDRAADYIADVFQKYGVKPAGDDNTYFQNFSLQLEHKLGEATRLAYGRDGRKMRIPLELNADYVPFPFSSSKSFEGNVVFAGYGIVDDDNKYNDYEGLDVTDKVVLVIRRAPEFTEFSPMLHQSFRAKAGRANARGAAALLIVNRNGDEDEALYPFGQGARGFGPSSYGIPMIHITEEAANRLLDSADMPTILELQEQIEADKKPASKELAGVSIRGNVEINPVDSPVRNVVGLIPGQGPQSDEIIVLGAHYDHLGIRNKGEPQFDPTTDISNGADDNASGTTLVMAMAKAYTEGPPPNRSMLLILFTGEELGLLGSAHFAKNPTVDLSKCVAMLNFDMVGRLKNNRLEVGGMRTGEGFEDMVKSLADRYELEIRDGGGGRGPSDHTHFYNNKIPVLFFFTGIHRQYHKPDDDTPLINFDGAMRITRYAADIIDEIDASPQRPAYQNDTRRASIGRQNDDDEPARTARRADRADRGDRAAARSDGDRPTGGVRLGVIPDMDADEGLIVAEVNEESPAAKAGVKPGDKIVRIGKINIGGIDDAVEALAKLEPGDRTTLGIDRDGEKIEVRVSFAGPGRGSEEKKPLASVHDEIKKITEGRLFERGGPVQKYTIRQGTGKIDVEIETRTEEDALEVFKSVKESLAKIAADLKDTSISATVTTTKAANRIRVQHSISIGSAATGSSADAHAGVDPHAAPKNDGHTHGEASDDETRETMPSVRLGIMPTYGESKGEGYEIDGVTEDGPAAKAGMKDGDRIYQIGGKKIKNVYDYMEALRKYKPGDEIPVVIIRDGKKIDLKDRAGEAKSEPK